MSIKLKKLGNQVILILPNQAVKMPGFKAGSFVRVTPVGRDLKVTPVAVPRVYDAVPFEQDDESQASLG